MRKPSIKIETTIHSREYENQKHLEFGPELPAIKPLAEPKKYIASIATALNEVLAGVRSVEQMHPVLQEHVFESLKRRSNSGAQARLLSGKKAVIQPTEVVQVRYQEPAEGVIESVVILSNRQRAKAVTIRKPRT
jgi:hypothetical protein